MIQIILLGKKNIIDQQCIEKNLIHKYINNLEI
jgi:hypothetical protein